MRKSLCIVENKFLLNKCFTGTLFPNQKKLHPMIYIYPGCVQNFFLGNFDRKCLIKRVIACAYHADIMPQSNQILGSFTHADGAGCVIWRKPESKN